MRTLVNKNYQKGYRFEKRVAKYIRDEISKYVNLKCYLIESRGSKGKADLVVGIYNTDNGGRTWAGIQCKKGYISKPEMHRGAYRAMADNGMLLYFATVDTQNNINIYPDLLNDWLSIGLEGRKE
jgi:hypothetical protein